MQFQSGVRSWQNFPQNDSIFEHAYIKFQPVQTNSFKLSRNNYFEGDNGSIDRDLQILSSCDGHATETNDYYNGGQLKNKMTEWMRLATEVRDLKGRILPGNITKDITQYNDNLERAKKERILQKFKQCCADFNNAKHVKKAGYYEYVDWYDWDGTYWYQYVWHEPEYWEITGYEGYNYQSLGSLAMLIENMERQSGISFMDPRDWQKKLQMNGRDDAAFKYM